MINFKKHIRGFLDPKICDQVVEIYDHLGIKKLDEFGHTLSGINQTILENIVAYSLETKYLPETQHFSTISEHLRFIQQTCYSYDGIKITAALGCKTLELGVKEDSAPSIIKIADQDFMIDKHYQEPDNILDFIIYLGGVGSEIVYDRLNTKVTPEVGDLLISPSLWTHNFKISNTGIGESFYLIYRIASDPSKYKKLDF